MQKLLNKSPDSKFEIHLDNFDGPFDLLLSLIAKHKLDITKISLSAVTDEFIEYVKKLTKLRDTSDNFLLNEVSQFILIAATLLEIKTARLLPGNKDIGEEDLELLDARDLLFAKLLQYKAYKDIAQEFQKKMEGNKIPFYRHAPLEDKFKEVLPKLIFRTTKSDVEKMAADVFSMYALRNHGVNLSHIHMQQVNVAEQTAIVCQRLKKAKTLTFGEILEDAKGKSNYYQIMIGRFLSLLELYKLKAIEIVQKKALTTLKLSWIAENSFDYSNLIKSSDFDK